MPSIKQLSRAADTVKNANNINWFPGHMYSGMQAMIGKLHTVDCIIEVHDARIPFAGRNDMIRKNLGVVKPRLLVLNKSDLADLSRWKAVKKKLHEKGDDYVFLTDLTGSSFSFGTRGYTSLLENVMKAINESNRYNRAVMDHFKVMIVGIPNVGKSTLINRLRQQHIGKKGEPAKTGPDAGVTRHVHNMIKICSRPPIYSLDTPGVLQPGCTKNKEQAMRLALCSTISDRALNPEELASFLLNYLNSQENYLYLQSFGLEKPAACLLELIEAAAIQNNMAQQFKAFERGDKTCKSQIDQICWKFVREFRKGLYGNVMFD